MLTRADMVVTLQIVDFLDVFRILYVVKQLMFRG
jgi:hypothetical protein